MQTQTAGIRVQNLLQIVWVIINDCNQLSCFILFRRVFDAASVMLVFHLQSLGIETRQSRDLNICVTISTEVG